MTGSVLTNGRSEGKKLRQEVSTHGLSIKVTESSNDDNNISTSIAISVSIRALASALA